MSNDTLIRIFYRQRTLEKKHRSVVSAISASTSRSLSTTVLYIILFGKFDQVNPAADVLHNIVSLAHMRSQRQMDRRNQIHPNNDNAPFSC